MIDVKVKTLDSQNHDFTVNEEFNVKQFKEHIASTVNVPADQQRIIYCGRILNDEKKLKDYDVHGKVVHLVIRPPPGQRPENSNLDNPQPNTTTPRRISGDNGGARFLGRTIDGIVGAVAAVQAAGLNNSNNNNGSLNPSSTLCMNRITVARYMLQCVNNIVTHLNDPTVALNNAPMDILVNQTLESAVVEVGISAVADADRMQDIVHAFRDAANTLIGSVSNGTATNQQEQVMMTVGTPAADGAASITTPVSASAEAGSTTATPNVNVASAEDAPATVEAPMDTTPSSAGSNTGGCPPATSSSTLDPMAVDASASSPSHQPRPRTEGGNASNATPENNGPSEGAGGSSGRQQTTSTQTLASVVQEMRNAHSRLEPYMQQYYDLLQGDPAFENDTARETAQRVFDRVSEAMHYMSHAQHAISDLMLDCSLASPRHLCCRPILIEQSAFVSPGFGTPYSNMVFRSAGVGIDRMPQMPPHHPPPPSSAATAPTTPSGAATAPTTPSTGANPTPPQQPQLRPNGGGSVPFRGPISGHQPHHHHHHQHIATIPIVVQQAPGDREAFRNGGSFGGIEPDGIHELIQSIMNAAGPLATTTIELHQEASPDGPPPPSSNQSGTAAGNNQQQQQPPSINGSGPTRMTVTGATGHPQIRNVRPVAAPHVVSAFDRFLPCNSHHIRDSHNRAMAPRMMNGAGSVNLVPPGGLSEGILSEGMIQIDASGMIGGSIPVSIRVQPSSIRRPNDATGQNRSSTNRGGAAATAPATNNNSNVIGRSSTSSASPAPQPRGTNNTDLERLYRSEDLDEVFVVDIRTELRQLIVRRFFNNAEITEGNIIKGVSEIIISLDDVLAPLSDYQHPYLSIRKSIITLIRSHLQEMLNMLRVDDPQRFGGEFIRSVRELAFKISKILLQSDQRRQDIKQMFRALYLRFVKSLEPRPIGRILVFCLKVCLQTLDKKFATNDVEGINDYFHYDLPAVDEAGDMEVEEAITSNEVAASSTATAERSVGALEAVASTSRIATPTDEHLFDLLNNCEPMDEDDRNDAAAAAWHSQVPSAWVRPLSRDMDSQKENTTDCRAEPLSDAYLEGMSKKRRKTVSEARPTRSIPDLIGAGVRRAIQNSGFQTQTPPDQITNNIASDTGVQNSYREAMHNSIKERLQKDPNFDPKKYPNSSNYFK